jgi:hypothetical protein
MLKFNNLNEFCTHQWKEVTPEETKKGVFINEWKIDECVIDDDGKVLKATIIFENERPVIGNVIKIDLPEINCEGLEAKIDSGAEMSCLHAEDIKQNDKRVTFVFCDKKITMNCSGSVDVQTADNGTVSRPVIKLNVKTESNEIKGVDFNLNDRSEMPHQILLGKAFLQQGNFLIDPKDEEHETKASI